MSRRHQFHLLLGFLVTAGCFVAAFWGFDRQDYVEIATSFQRANYWTLPGLLLLLALFFWLKAVRWALLLRPLRPANPLSVRQTLPALMIGFMGNNLLPAHLGDFLRVFVLGRRYRVSNAAVLSTVVLERIFDVAAILALLGWGLAASPSAPPEARRTGMLLAVMLVVGLAGIFVYATWTSWFVRTTEGILGRLSFLPEALRRKACDLLEAGALGMAALRSGRLCLGIVATSAAQWAINVWMIDLALAAFDIDKSLAVSAVVMGVVAFGVTIPSTPGFFGVIQVAFRASLVPFGVAATNAVAASVYYHFVTWASVTLVGLFFLQKTGLRLRQLEHVAEEAEEEGEGESGREGDGETVSGARGEMMKAA